MRKTTLSLLFLMFIFSTLNAQYITGNAFKKLCHYSFDEYGYAVNNSIDNNYWFVKTDKLDEFFEKYLPEDDFFIISHNADHGVTEKYLPYLELPNLIGWYGQNIETSHHKLISIPIGLCNAAKFKTFENVQRKNYSKKKLVYANYAIPTNREERELCRKETGVPIPSRKPFKEFLKNVAKSYFVIAPDGNGVDTHRLWEALYLKAIPIVTRSINTEFYEDLPIIILDSWADYKNLELSPELYHQIWGDFDPDTLTVERFIQPANPHNQ